MDKERKDVDDVDIDKTHLDEFRDNGATLIKGVLSDFWLAKINLGIERNKVNPSPRAVVDERSLIQRFLKYTIYAYAFRENKLGTFLNG